MEFEWDESKRQRVIEGRGVDFLDAMLIFAGPIVTKVDRRRDYGETRFISLGMVDETCYVVVHTRRDDNIRIISAWLGGRRERQEYQENISGRTPEAQG